MARKPRATAASILALCGFVLVLVDCSRTRTRQPTSSATPGVSLAPPALAAPPNPATPPLPSNARTEDEKNTIRVFRESVASTVFVTQKRIVVDYLAGRAKEVPAGSGSGFIWDEQGHVVTNFHVVKGARALTVTLHDHTHHPAKVVGVEPRKDIAVVKVDVSKGLRLSPVRVPPKAERLEVGQKTIAIGNPFGLDQTLTTGIVSALGREVDGIGGVSIRDMIQTDAAINPGNSGGPLLDSAGQLIGMNTMIYSRSGASAGIGFAVPVSSIARVVPQLIKHGKTQQVGLGIGIDPAQRLERRANLRGVIVLSVQPGSPAAQAGLQGIKQTREGIRLGDVIVTIDEHPIADYDDLYNTLDRYHTGDEVKVTVLRGKDKVTVKLKLTLLE